MKINHHCTSSGSDCTIPCLKVQRWIVCYSSHGVHLRELFAEESLTTFPGYLLKQHSASLLIYSHFRHHPHHLQGEMMGPVYPPAYLPRNTLKSSEFKSSWRRSLRAPCRGLWSFAQIPVPPGFPHNTATSWQSTKARRTAERKRETERHAAVIVTKTSSLGERQSQEPICLL